MQLLAKWFLRQIATVKLCSSGNDNLQHQRLQNLQHVWRRLWNLIQLLSGGLPCREVFFVISRHEGPWPFSNSRLKKFFWVWTHRSIDLFETFERLPPWTMKGLRWVRNSSWRKKYFKSRKDIRPCRILRCFFLYHDFDPFPVPGIVRILGCSTALLPHVWSFCHCLLPRFQVLAATAYCHAVCRVATAYWNTSKSLLPCCLPPLVLPALYLDTFSSMIPTPFLWKKWTRILSFCQVCATLLPRLCPTPVILVPHFCHTLLPLCCQTSATLLHCFLPHRFTICLHVVFHSRLRPTSLNPTDSIFTSPRSKKTWICCCYMWLGWLSFVAIWGSTTWLGWPAAASIAFLFHRNECRVFLGLLHGWEAKHFTC